MAKLARASVLAGSFAMVLSAQSSDSRTKKVAPTAKSPLINMSTMEPFQKKDNYDAPHHVARGEKTPAAPSDAAVQAKAPAGAVAPAPPTVDRVNTPAIPPRDISPEQLAKVKVGMTGEEVAAALGPAASSLAVPDDNGHLIEHRQYLSKGVRAGTVHLDNGRVVSIDHAVKPKS